MWKNPNPGQIHYQDGSGKYIYDVGKGEFKGLSATQNRQLLSSQKFSRQYKRA
jgi:hypothetical protein